MMVMVMTVKSLQLEPFQASNKLSRCKVGELHVDDDDGDGGVDDYGGDDQITHH